MPQQAVRVLDSEIDRLDNVVKRFLDFTRPPEMHQEEASLKNILEEVLAVETPQMDKANIKVDRATSPKCRRCWWTKHF